MDNSEYSSEMLASQKRPDAKMWMQYLQYASLSLGVGFLVFGVIFFFAYNWERMHRFGKLGIVLALIMATYVVVAKVPMRDWVRKVSIMAMCMLVGVFLAVYGQIYQTGANSFVLPLTWMACIFVWVVVADFYPLWLFFVLLAWLSISLFCQENTQLRNNNFYSDYVILLFAGFLSAFKFAPNFFPKRAQAPSWFVCLLALGANVYAEVDLCLFLGGDNVLPVKAFIALLVVGGVYLLAVSMKNLFLYSLFFIDVLCAFFAVYINLIFHNNEGLIYLSPIVFIAAFALCVHLVLKKRKEWNTLDNGTNTGNLSN